VRDVELARQAMTLSHPTSRAGSPLACRPAAPPGHVHIMHANISWPCIVSGEPSHQSQQGRSGRGSDEHWHGGDFCAFVRAYADALAPAKDAQSEAEGDRLK
jgi:hypothetical protein